MSERFDELRREVLSLATEDLMGLWEAWWRANSMFPGLRASERLALTEQVIIDLRDKRLIRLYRGSWLAQAEVPADQVDTVLRNPSSWEAYQEDALTFFFATDEGERAYLLPSSDDSS